MLPISFIFLEGLGPMIFAKYCKKAVRRETLGTIQRISLSRAHVNLTLNSRSVIYIYCMRPKY
jgi:hypothetical protein